MFSKLPSIASVTDHLFVFRRVTADTQSGSQVLHSGLDFYEVIKLYVANGSLEVSCHHSALQAITHSKAIGAFRWLS